MNKSDTVIFIRCLLVAHKEMYVLPEFLKDFEEEMGYELPSFGHGTVLDFLKSIPDTVQVIPIKEKIYLKYVDSQKSAHIRAAVLRTRGGSGLKKEVNEAVDHSSFLSGYLEDSESTTEEESCEGTSKKEKLKKKMNSELIDVKTHDDICESCSDEEWEDDNISKRNITRDEGIDKYMSSIILDESDIPTINLTDHGEVGDCVEVFVPEVCNPHKFILHLRKFKTELAKLMGRMLKFYSSHFNNYAIKKFKLKRNHVCAVIYETQPDLKEWYRAKIVNYGAECSVVLLLDYGINVEVNNSNLMYLNRDFGNLPVQAINGHVANIRPSDGNYWSEECNKSFFELVFEKNLVARIVAIDSEERTLSMTLSGTNEDVQISDSLIEKGFATFDLDCNEKEPFSPVICESINSKGFLLPESIGRIRTIRSYCGYCGRVKSKKNKRNRRPKNKPRKISETEVRNDDSE